MDRIIPYFETWLDKFDLATLEEHPSAIFSLLPDLRICYLNPGWFSFAAANGGEPGISIRFPIGTLLSDAISGPLRDYYIDAYTRVFDSGKVWEHDYECSTPDTFRIYHQAAYPLDNKKAIIVINSLSVEMPHDETGRKSMQALEKKYRNKNGFITQCGHCRRTQRVDGVVQWDWVPAWVAVLPKNISHGLCKPCFDYYYKYHVKLRN